MAQYPNLAECSLPEDPCPAYEDLSESTSDDEDCGSNVMDGYMYDDHGELVPVSADGPSEPVISTAPVNGPPPPSEFPRPPITKAMQVMSGTRDVVVPRDSSGKLGVKLTRMGPRMFFSYVETSSSAAKCGLGFGDQLLAIEGINFKKLSGTRLMSVLASSPAQSFKFTVLMRPYDFVLQGLVTPDMDLQYFTRQGKCLGTVKVSRVARTGCIRNLKLLAVGDQKVFCWKETQLLTVLQGIIGKRTDLRVMPAQLYQHLMRRQDKERVKNIMQLSPRIL